MTTGPGRAEIPLRGDMRSISGVRPIKKKEADPKG